MLRTIVINFNVTDCRFINIYIPGKYVHTCVAKVNKRCEHRLKPLDGHSEGKGKKESVTILNILKVTCKILILIKHDIEINEKAFAVFNKLSR